MPRRDLYKLQNDWDTCIQRMPPEEIPNENHLVVMYLERTEHCHQIKEYEAEHKRNVQMNRQEKSYQCLHDMVDGYLRARTQEKNRQRYEKTAPYSGAAFKGNDRTMAKVKENTKDAEKDEAVAEADHHGKVEAKESTKVKEKANGPMAKVKEKATTKEKARKARAKAKENGKGKGKQKGKGKGKGKSKSKGPRPRGVCRNFFQYENCVYGEDCAYSHGDGTSKGGSKGKWKDHRYGSPSPQPRGKSPSGLTNRTVCRYHLTVAGCNKENCDFWHSPMCSKYQEGKCQLGDQCMFKHYGSYEPGSSSKTRRKRKIKRCISEGTIPSESINSNSASAKVLSSLAT